MQIEAVFSSKQTMPANTLKETDSICEQNTLHQMTMAKLLYYVLVGGGRRTLFTQACSVAA